MYLALHHNLTNRTQSRKTGCRYRDRDWYSPSPMANVAHAANPLWCRIVSGPGYSPGNRYRHSELCPEYPADFSPPYLGLRAYVAHTSSNMQRQIYIRAKGERASLPGLCEMEPKPHTESTQSARMPVCNLKGLSALLCSHHVCMIVASVKTLCCG